MNPDVTRNTFEFLTYKNVTTNKLASAVSKPSVIFANIHLLATGLIEINTEMRNAKNLLFSLKPSI